MSGKVVFGVGCYLLSQQQQMNKLLEEHVIKLDVQIKELHFAIVLPAKITFTINIDSKVASQSRKVHYLQTQNCLPFQRHVLEFNADFDTKKNSYRFKQISLVTHYQDSKGLQGSRRVQFDPFAKNFGDKQWLLPSSNSPEFKVVFVTSFVVLSKKGKSSRVTNNGNDLYKYGSLRKEGYADKKASVINELIKTEDSKRQSQANLRQGFADKTKRLQHIKSVPIEAKKRSTKNRLTIKNNEQSDQLTTKPQDELQSLKKKIQLQREQKVRSITKLKMEVSPNFPPLNTQESQVNKLKEKIRNLQRKEKNLQSNIQDLNSDLQKRKNKMNQLQKRKEELQKELIEKDIKLKTANSTIRTLNQQIQSLVSKEKITIKKTQTKETMHREQLRKLEEKIKLMELQISKVNDQKTNSMKGLQFCEKIHQNALKEKEIRMSEQKSKFSKQREEFFQREQALVTSVDQLNTKIQNLQFQKGQLQEKVMHLQQRQFNYENEIAALKQSIKLQRQQNDKQLDQRMAKLNTDINSGRSKYNQIMSEANSLKEKLKRSQSIKADNEARIKQLQESLKAKSGQLNKLTNKMASTKQQLDTCIQQNNRKGRQLESLKQSITLTKQKLIQAKEKIQEQRRSKEQANSIIDRQIAQQNKQREAHESQIQQLKWTIIRSNDSISELQHQIQQHNNSILKLTEQQMAKSQMQSQLQDKLKQSQYSIEIAQRQKNNLLGRIKQLNQNIRLKNLQLQEQKKQRVKFDRNFEEEKQKLRQHMAFTKEKEAQEEERRTHRQLLMVKKQEQISRLQLQLTKRKDEINGLKNSCDLVLREVHLSKMENDTVKGQLNILQANYRALKQQNISLQQAQQKLTASLGILQQNINMQNKKQSFLQKEYDQYKETIERAFQNLCAQLFKDQANSSNVIGASLLPFPTQRLSTLQVELIQKRNNFIIKYRQRVLDLQNQNDAVQHQIEQIKQLYEEREEAGKKLQDEQRQKLKGLLYEGMVEKNGLTEQLILQRKERQEHQKQIQKLKVQLFKREEIEQQLNGQLQILMLEYDGLKAQNQDLNTIIFKYKASQAQHKAQFDQSIALLQEEYATQLEKLKAQNLDKERKIIQIEKELSESSQKIRKAQEERYKSHGLLESCKQNNRILDQRLSQSQMQITKLNNMVKSLQKKDGSSKQAYDKLQAQLSLQINKAEILQNSLIKLTTEHFETNVEKERIMGQLKNAQQKCSDLQKMLLQKGETNKQKIEKKIQENSSLKSILIQRTSELELKDFYLKQKEQQSQNLIQENQELKLNITMMKNKLKQVSISLQQSEGKLKECTRQIDQLVRERQRKQEKLSESNFMIISLQSELDEMSSLVQIVQSKEKQCIQLRQNKNQSEQYYINELKKQKEIIAELRRQVGIQRSNYEHLEEEYSSSLESLSKTNTQKYKYLENQFMQEKDQFCKRVEEIQSHNKRVVAEYESRVEKLKEELQQCKEYEKCLSEQAEKKQSIIRNLSKRNEQLENELDDFRQKYNKYYQLYQQSKAQVNQSAKENQSKLINSLEKSKASQIKQYSFRIGEIQRKIDRLQLSEQFEVKSDSMTKRQIKNLIQKLLSKVIDMLRDIQIDYKGDAWRDSKAQSVY